MSTVVTLEQAQSQLKELVAGLAEGEEIVITDEHRPVAKLVIAEAPIRKPRQAGSAVGVLSIVHEDDEHLRDFEEYMR
jgi:antitoxin (DNA-binding transcriptional repressor) of toxin-antitoxin stability system